MNLNGNIFLDFENDSIGNFFDEITKILTSDKIKTNQDLLINFQSYFQDILKNLTKENKEFQNFFNGVKNEFEKTNKSLLKNLQSEFKDIKSDDLNQFLGKLGGEHKNIELNPNEKRLISEEEGKKINNQNLYLNGFYLERGSNFIENIFFKILKVQDTEIIFKKIIKPHDFDDYSSKSKNRIFKKYFSPHGISKGKNKKDRFGQNLNQNLKYTLDLRKELERETVYSSKINKANFINNDDIEIKFNSNGFNLFTEGKKIPENFKIEKMNRIKTL